MWGTKAIEQHLNKASNGSTDKELAPWLFRNELQETFLMVIFFIKLVNKISFIKITPSAKLHKSEDYIKMGK